MIYEDKFKARDFSLIIKPLLLRHLGSQAYEVFEII